MTGNDLIAMERGFGAVSNLKGKKFNYAMCKNEKLVQRKLKELREGMGVDGLEEYHNKRREMAMKYTKPMPNNPGRAMMDPEKMDQFNDEVKTLDEEYKEVLEKQKVKDAEMEEKLQVELPEEFTKQFHHIKFNDVPDEITKNQMGPFIDIIDDEEVDDTPTPIQMVPAQG